jgi:hypothetical protein
MAFYGYTAQPIDYSFIQNATAYAAQGIEDASKLRASNETADRAHEQLIDQAKQLYKDKTGDTDDVKATAFAYKFFPGRYKKETGDQAVSRWDKSDKLFKEALESQKAVADRAVATDIGKQISGGYGPEVYKEVMAGQSTLDQINQKYGTSLTQADYERIAGLQTPTIQKPMTPNTSDVGPVRPKADMAAVKAAADKPMDYATASAQTPISKPMPYDQAIAKITDPNVSPEAMKMLSPILTTAANKRVAEVAAQPGQTEKGLYAGVASEGMGVDETSKAIGGAMRAEDALEWQKKKQSDLLEYKKRYSQMREKEQDVSLLKILLQDAWKRGDFAKEYGKDATKAAEDLFAREKERADIDQQIQQALNWDSLPYEYTKNKPEPDYASLMAKWQAVDNDISRLRSLIPETQIKADSYRKPTVVQKPYESDENSDNKSIPSPATPVDYSNDNYKRAKKVLVAEFKRNNISREPTPREIQSLINNPRWQ